MDLLICIPLALTDPRLLPITDPRLLLLPLALIDPRLLRVEEAEAARRAEAVRRAEEAETTDAKHFICV